MTTDAMIGRAGKCMFFLRVGGTSRTPELPYRPTELIIVKFFCAERADGPSQPIVFLAIRNAPAAPFVWRLSAAQQKVGGSQWLIPPTQRPTLSAPLKPSSRSH